MVPVRGCSPAKRPEWIMLTTHIRWSRTGAWPFLARKEMKFKNLSRRDYSAAKKKKTWKASKPSRKKESKPTQPKVSCLQNTEQTDLTVCVDDQPAWAVFYQGKVHFNGEEFPERVTQLSVTERPNPVSFPHMNGITDFSGTASFSGIS